jgi:hypothetical protein
MLAHTQPEDHDVKSLYGPANRSFNRARPRAADGQLILTYAEQLRTTVFRRGSGVPIFNGLLRRHAWKSLGAGDPDETIRCQQPQP